MEIIPQDFESKLKGNTIDVFNETLKKHKYSPAIYYFDSVFTFNDLDIQSNILATAMRHETAKRSIKLELGDMIAIYCQNTPVTPSPFILPFLFLL